MLVHLQMTRLTVAALLERNGKPVTLADWRNHILQRDKTGGDKGFKMQDGNSLND
jgi:hypothetical protein